MTVAEMPEELVIDACQLVKANSIEGCKRANVGVVFTPWANLKKTAGCGAAPGSGAGRGGAEAASAAWPSDRLGSTAPRPSRSG